MKTINLILTDKIGRILARKIDIAIFFYFSAETITSTTTEMTTAKRKVANRAEAIHSKAFEMITFLFCFTAFKMMVSKK